MEQYQTEIAPSDAQEQQPNVTIVEGEEPKKPFPGILGGLFLLFLLLIFSVAMGSVMLIYVAIIGEDSSILTSSAAADMPMIVFLISVSQVIPFLTVIIVGLWQTKRPLKETLPFKRPNVSMLLLFLVATLGMMIINGPLSRVFVDMFPKSAEYYMETIGGIITEFPLWAALLIAAVFAPLLEEVLFRGVMLVSFLKRYPAIVAILFSSLFFAAAHFSPFHVVGTILIALLLGYGMYITKTLWVPILMHVLNNGLSILVGRYYPEIGAQLDQYWMIIPGTIILAGALLVIYKKHSRDKKIPQPVAVPGSVE